MKQALLVIDVQESFRHRPYWHGDELPAFLENVQSLVDGARARGIPVLQVFHAELTNDARDPFSRTSGLVRPMPELSLVADAVFYKHVHSAMFAKMVDNRAVSEGIPSGDNRAVSDDRAVSEGIPNGEGIPSGDGVTLEDWLRQHGIEEVLVTGIRTEQCCETTSRHASDLGFKVRYVTDATLTFPMRSRSGRDFSPAEIRERTELVLDGRFARVVTSAEALG